MLKSENYLEKIRTELSKYEHPLFEWIAYPMNEGVDVLVYLKYQGIHDEPYKFHLTSREIESVAFEWDFQRQLYNYLHDYLIEMFIKNPQITQ